MRTPGEPVVSAAVWAASTAALAALDVEQAEAVVGGELMLDIAEATSNASGRPYSGRELAQAAAALLLRRPST